MLLQVLSLFLHHNENHIVFGDHNRDYVALQINMLIEIRHSQTRLNRKWVKQNHVKVICQNELQLARRLLTLRVMNWWCDWSAMCNL